MKLIIAGSRKLGVDLDTIGSTVKHFKLKPTEVVSGMADGTDTFGFHWSIREGIPVKPFPVTKEDWDEIGKPAGPLRNKEMAEYADALLLIWDGKSPGSTSMRNFMIQKGKPVYELILTANEPEYRETHSGG